MSPSIGIPYGSPKDQEPTAAMQSSPESPSSQLHNSNGASHGFLISDRIIPKFPTTRGSSSPIDNPSPSYCLALFNRFIVFNQHLHPCSCCANHPCHPCADRVAYHAINHQCANYSISCNHHAGQPQLEVSMPCQSPPPTMAISLCLS